MTAQMTVWILAVCLAACMAVLILSTAYFLRQWRRLDEILDGFWQEEPEVSGDYPDVLETRESRVVSQLRQILAAARFKEQQAVGEKDQVMELISDLSHQLKTPLANIIMNTEFLQDLKPGEEQKSEFLEHIRSQADKMQWLMANLLKASRLENGMIHFDAGYTGIQETFAQAVRSVFAQACG